MLKRDREASDRLTATPHPGLTPRRNAERLKQSEGLLREGAKAHGGPNDLWSAHWVAAVIRRHFGVESHIEHARQVIRRRLNWSRPRPQRKARPRNDEKIAP